MSFTELLEGMPRENAHPLRVNQTVLDWKIGEVYEAKIQFVLTEMDQLGMTLMVHKFEPNTSEEQEKTVIVVKPTVVPSPS